MEITHIKSNLTITAVLGHYNLKPDKHDMLLCPFHEDKNPSLKIYPNTNTFHCFGCSANGDVIEFIQLKEASTGSACSKHAAIEKAAEMTGLNPNPTLMEKPTEKELLPRLAILAKLAQDSRMVFKRGSQGKDYLLKRGLDPEKTNVGYIGKEFGTAWNKKLKESAVSLGILKLMPDNNTAPKFNNCVLFFTKNKGGQITGLYARSVQENTLAKHFYLSGSHEGIYPCYPTEETKRLILTESIIDCETLLQQAEIAENYSIISLYGVNGFTAEIKTAIAGLKGLEEVTLFFDGDKAGRDAVKKTANTLQEIQPKIKITRVETPEGEDINSLLQGHEDKVLVHLLETRKQVHVALPPGTTESPMPVLNTITQEKLTLHDGGFLFTIWGGIEKDNIHRLKINLLVQLKNEMFKYYQDDVNLYSNGQLQRYIKGASEETECSTSGLKHAITRLKHCLEQYRHDLIEKEKKALKPQIPMLTKQETTAAMEFLQSESLVQDTLLSIEKSGLVGEEKNGLLLYFLYLSRLFDEPLHAIIFGKSGSGKTYLQTKISECLPEESVRTITSLTENTLYYSSKGFWKHKLLLIEDLEGVYNAFLPLREFMSKQSISKLTTERDSKGNNVQKILVAEGPVCVSGATTKVNIYEDNANRSFLLHVDESPGHTYKVMEYQRKVQAGMINNHEQDTYKKLLKNSQRLLKKVRVINPYATMLDIPQCVFKKLRTNLHYLKLIEIIAFYHQYQREHKKNMNGDIYIEASVQDIEWANYLIKESLLRKSDELGGQLRQFFESLKSLTDKTNTKVFYAKQVREVLRMNPMTLSRYLRELEQRSYIQRTGGNRKTGFEYEVKAWDEYEKLKKGIDILDGILEGIRKKVKYNNQNGKYNSKKLSITPV